MTQRKRLALIDGHALAFRAFHALREAGMRASSGEPTYAVFGFAQILLTMIQEQRPNYVAVSFDVGRTFRDDLYADYKAGRSETPEEFHPQLERIKALMTALNIPIYTLDGYEADDVIGTLACQASAQDVATLILTGDTDSLQLVDGHVQVLLANPYAKGGKTTTLYDEAAVRERYDGLAPAQLADLRGLKGDTSDNIPGVKGIGEKGAIALLNQFSTVENLFDHLDEAPNRYKKVLDGQREAALFSKRLATIVCDAPVQLDLAACVVDDYDRAAVIRLFQELEIGARSGLLKKLPPMAGEPAVSETDAQPLGDTPPPPAPARAAKGPVQHDLFAEALPDTLAAAPEAVGTVQLNLFGEPASPVATARPAPAGSGAYVAITSEATLDELVAALRAAGGFAFDTESTGLRPLDSGLVGISLAHTPGSAAYIPVGHAAGEQLPRERVLDAVRPLFEDEGLPKYAHNAKFDIEMLESAGVRVRGLTFDTMVAAALLNKKVGLKDLAFYELRDHPTFALTEPPTPIEELIGRGQKQISFDQVPITQATPYAAADADLTLRLKEVLEPQLRAHPRILDIFARLEMPLVEVLTAMEQAGITLDKGYIEGLGVRLGERIGELAEQIYAAAGQRFNINSGAQLNAVLFDSGKFSLDPKALGLSKLKTGGYSITAEVLEQMAPVAPIAALILNYRQLSKLKSTYVDALPALVSPKTKRVHTSYNQVGSATGRLSCLPAGTLVNTQNGLVGIEEVRPGDTVRTAFGPREVTAWAATGPKPVVVLKLSNGITLRCSPEHQLRSLGHWVEARDLKVGVPLYMSYTPGMFGSETKLNIDYTSHYDTRKTPSLPTDWSVELAELVGYHMADGHIARSNYNGKPSKVILAFGEVAEIRVPPSLYRAPEEIVAGFLRGYFEGDGSVSADVISVRSVSRAMLEDVQQLLTLFGITSQITKGSPDPQGYAQRYTLRLAGRRSNAIFHQRIGFLANKKHLLSWGAAQQHEAPHTVKNSAELLTLSPGFAISELKPFIHAVERGEDGRVSMAAHSLISKVATGRTNTLTMARAEWIVAALPPDHASASAAFLREAVEGQYFEVTISAIEHETPVPMYDIAVADVQQYIANGLTLHNSVDPNLQNIPVRTLEGREIRRGFVAAPGCCFVAADYSQIELRVLAHYTRDPALMATFQEGRDIHAATASRLFGVEQSKVDKNQRRIAKTLVFGIIYGISSFGLSSRLGLTRAESQALIDGVFASFPGIKVYIDETLAFAREHGYVTTLFGRRRAFPELASGDRGPRAQAAMREAINAPIQGTAADIMKIAMINLHRALAERGMATKMLLQVHDELILEAPAHEVEAAARLAREVMEGAYPALAVPLGVEVETGTNWEEMKPV